MTLDPRRLRAALAAHGPVARVVVAGARGSVPREAGAEMLVWAEGQAGTIGGGALEWEAARAARALLASGGAPRLTRHPLGPALGQCCGGAVSLVTEVLAAVPEGPARALRLDGDAPEPPREGPTRIEGGWLVEPVREAGEPLWIWGAGHVGRALVATLAPLDRFDLLWIDVAAERFPEAPAAEPVVAADPPALAARAPKGARHLVVTHSHPLDLALCDALLRRGFASCGLIGSETKWARFRSRLGALGHAEAAVARIDCPIGEPALGKHPQAIAVGVAAQLLRPARPAAAAARLERRA